MWVTAFPQPLTVNSWAASQIAYRRLIIYTNDVFGANLDPFRLVRWCQIFQLNEQIVTSSRFKTKTNDLWHRPAFRSCQLSDTSLSKNRSTPHLLGKCAPSSDPFYRALRVAARLNPSHAQISTLPTIYIL